MNVRYGFGTMLLRGMSLAHEGVRAMAVGSPRIALGLIRAMQLYFLKSGFL
jgi:hypothetical protein